MYLQKESLITPFHPLIVEVVEEELSNGVMALIGVHLIDLLLVIQTGAL